MDYDKEARSGPTKGMTGKIIETRFEDVLVRFDKDFPGGHGDSDRDWYIFDSYDGRVTVGDVIGKIRKPTKKAKTKRSSKKGGRK